MVGRARAYAASCERRSGGLLPHMTIADNARDLDAIRAALGVPQISYYGACVNRYLARYLATGALPPGTGLVSATCPALPLPHAAGGLTLASA